MSDAEIRARIVELVAEVNALSHYLKCTQIACLLSPHRKAFEGTPEQQEQALRELLALPRRWLLVLHDDLELALS